MSLQPPAAVGVHSYLPNLPPEVLLQIVGHVDQDSLQGLGSVCRALKRAVRDRPARLYDNTDPALGAVNKSWAADASQIRSLDKLRLKQGQCLTFNDLEGLKQCLERYGPNDTFWDPVEAILFSYIDRASDADRFLHPLKVLTLAPATITALVCLLISLRYRRKRGIKVVRMKFPLWGSVPNVDVPGFFALTHLFGVKKFHYVPGKPRSQITNYIESETLKKMTKRTSRQKWHAWKPTGLENPCPKVAWKVQAGRGRRPGELQAKSYERFLGSRYRRMYKSAKNLWPRRRIPAPAWHALCPWAC